MKYLSSDSHLHLALTALLHSHLTTVLKEKIYTNAHSLQKCISKEGEVVRAVQAVFIEGTKAQGQSLGRSVPMCRNRSAPLGAKSTCV